MVYGQNKVLSNCPSTSIFHSPEPAQDTLGYSIIYGQVLRLDLGSCDLDLRCCEGYNVRDTNNDNYY
eukprot:scaffold55490_cov61-Cyclotella_meneghiniana.AAC.8